MPSSKWLPLYRALNQNKFPIQLRSQISASIREGDPKDFKHLATLTEYYRAESAFSAIMAECFPASSLGGQDLLKRVANIVGLELPKQVIVEKSQVSNK